MGARMTEKYPPIVIKELSSGYFRASGVGPCEWAQWPKGAPLTEAAFFPEASEAFRAALYILRAALREDTDGDL